MSRVRRLDEVLVNQIAAGEVIERPAAVVKELVENALDAGATAITVTLRDGGRELIRVTDDGHGMDRDDALLCLERHATSKIRTLQDLSEVASLGFRGEAIPSIASVSRFQILTRPHGDEVGTRVSVEGGGAPQITETGCAPGTEIEARALFFNVPVRRGFLRTGPTELGHCVESLTRLALCRPEVDFQLFHGDQRALTAPRAADRAQRIRDLLGRHAEGQLAVSFERGGLVVEGFIAPIGVHRPSAAGTQYVYVNGRYVRDVVLKKAVQEAYRGLVPRGRHPVVVLEIRLDPLLVDVNVHPSKIEVRFKDPGGVQRTVAEGLRQVLREGTPQPVALSPAPRPARPAPPTPTVAAHPSEDPRFAGGWEAPLPVSPPPPAPATPPVAAPREPWIPPTATRPTLPTEASPAPELPLSPRSTPLALPLPQRPELVAAPPLPGPAIRYRDLAVIGRLGDGLLLCDRGGDLILVDLVRARTLALMANMRRDGQASRRLAAPAQAELLRLEAGALADGADRLSGLGLSAEPLSATAALLHRVPMAIASVDGAALLQALGRALLKGQDDEALREVVAHHAAQRLPPPSSPVDLRSLLATLDEIDAPPERLIAAIRADELRRRLQRGDLP
ncbi:MAG: DNA mismatch repair endonuclease MutL [Deltaproteobacteria bacterium]|nr:DNA mismatch repair endonuclease MutL [Deltaproteobacteria bacterium]